MNTTSIWLSLNDVHGRVVRFSVSVPKVNCQPTSYDGRGNYRYWKHALDASVCGGYVTHVVLFWDQKSHWSDHHMTIT